MPRSPYPRGELRDDHFALIDCVVRHVVEFGSIPPLVYIAASLGISRQGVNRRLDGMAKAGIIPPRPRYAVRWFDLTPLGEELYAGRVREMRGSGSLRELEN